GGALPIRPGGPEEGEGDPPGLLGRLGGVQGAAAARPRPQPGGLPAAPPRRLPRRRRPAAAGAARALPLRVPEPSVEPDAGRLASAALPARATRDGAAAPRRGADALRPGRAPAPRPGRPDAAAPLRPAAPRPRRPACRAGAGGAGGRGVGAAPTPGQGHPRAVLLEGRTCCPLSSGAARIRGRPGRTSRRQTEVVARLRAAARRLRD